MDKNQIEHFWYRISVEQNKLEPGHWNIVTKVYPEGHGKYLKNTVTKMMTWNLCTILYCGKGSFGVIFTVYNERCQLGLATFCSKCDIYEEKSKYLILHTEGLFFISKLKITKFQQHRFC